MPSAGGFERSVPFGLAGRESGSRPRSPLRLVADLAPVLFAHVLTNLDRQSAWGVEAVPPVPPRARDPVWGVGPGFGIIRFETVYAIELPALIVNALAGFTECDAT